MVDWNLHIESNPDKLFWKPTVVNTRISVDLILEKLAAGDTYEDLKEAYPVLSNEDIIACLLFAADAINKEVIIPKAS